MRVLSRTWRQSRCPHRVTVSVQTMGFERVVCEACGHVSVRVPEDVETHDTEVDRAIFARPSDIGLDAAPGRHKTGKPEYQTQP